jgi:hypothetical protein
MKINKKIRKLGAVFLLCNNSAISNCGLNSRVLTLFSLGKVTYLGQRHESVALTVSILGKTTKLDIDDDKKTI